MNSVDYVSNVHNFFEPVGSEAEAALALHPVSVQKAVRPESGSPLALRRAVRGEQAVGPHDEDALVELGGVGVQQAVGVQI